MTQDMKKYGIAVPRDLADQIEAPLEYGDSRSQRIRELVALGVAAEEVMGEHSVYPRTKQERRELVREALQAYIPENY